MTITLLGNFGVDFSSETHHKKSLESLGHTVIALQEGQVSSDDILVAAQNSAMFVWVHTHGWQTPGSLSMVQVLIALKNSNIPTVTYHLDLWLGIERQKDLQNDEFYKHIGHFFATDKLMADWFNKETEVKGHYLPAGVFDQECIMLPPNQPMNDIIFVGSKGYHPEWSWRPKFINWLQETYGDRFKHYGGDGLGVVRGEALNQLYANTKVVVGDSLVLGFDYPYYWSDRVYETLGRGGFLLMPMIKGLSKEFEIGKDLDTFKFNDFRGIEDTINYYLENDEVRETIRNHGHETVKNNYTYKDRWKTIIETVGL